MGPSQLRDPPRITKASMVTAVSKLPWRAFQVLRKWAARAPVLPASTALSTKAVSFTRVVSMPMQRAASSSLRMAAMARPRGITSRRWHTQPARASRPRAGSR
jgi:hypothetical protein